ncbi:HYR-like domain-containing protein, partial [Winogradskyella pulchriflava]
NESTITRTWSLTDECNNTTTLVQTINVVDTTAPTFTAPADLTIECDVDATDLSITGDVTDEADNCSSGLEATYTDTVAAGSCANESTITRTWSLTDECNNTITLVQTINVVDTTPPTLTVPADITIECTEDESSANTGVATATDTCGSVTITESDVETAACGNTKTIVRTWTATDQCGNTTSGTQTITTEDTTPPTIDDSGVQNIDIQCGVTPDGTLEAWLANNAGATASDTCGTVTWSNDFGSNT